MRFKLDENFGTRTQNVFRLEGFDVKTVGEEGLHGITDSELFEVCRKERRCLVTFDLDFSNVLRFPPKRSYGIAIIRLPVSPSLSLLEDIIGRFLRAAKEKPIGRELWIVELDRIRIHQSDH
jgi:predicted nuclease of predicted toxin-antitoxin system